MLERNTVKQMKVRQHKGDSICRLAVPRQQQKKI